MSNDFNAAKAKRLVSKKNDPEINNILSSIRELAVQGISVLHIYHNVTNASIESLKKRGFKVVEAPSISIQKDNLYFSIYW